MTSALLLLGGLALAFPDPADTRMLTQPALSESNLVFSYADDLWVADADGNSPRRLTADQGVETNACISPDGKTLAFSAQYEGNVDVYVMPVSGGSPTRLTTHPAGDLVRGFTPDGKSVLFASPRHVHT